MKQIAFQQGVVNYRIDGKGKVVVLVHGFCEDHKMWDDFKQDLLEEKYKVISIDLPGFGLSTPLDQASIEQYADAVFAVVSAETSKPFLLVGHSMGGYTALAFAKKHGELLTGLALFHSHPYEDTKEKKASRLKQIEFIKNQGHALYAKQIIPQFFAARYIRSHPFHADKLIHRAARFPQAGITGALKAMAERQDQSEVLSNINCPVLFILGELDEAIPKDLAEQQLTLPKVASIHILPKVGHMGMLESRKATQLMIRKFAVFCQSFE